jgi:hypothetical protein
LIQVKPRLDGRHPRFRRSTLFSLPGPGTTPVSAITMPITAWLLTLEATHVPPTLARLHSDRRFRVADPVGCWTPVTADCDDDGEALQAELRALPGVTDVALVHAHFSDIDVGHGFDLGHGPRAHVEATP